MTSQTSTVATARAAVQLHLSGRVQGVGLRPSVARLAMEMRLAGSVRNTSGGVTIVVEGGADAVGEFIDRLPDQLPAGADVRQQLCTPISPAARVGFQVDHSDQQPSLVGMLVPPDVTVCDDCLAEVLDADDRRYGYPLTSCANCGPRYSLIDHVPWDRDSCSMSAFELCESCRTEYASAIDRRFHAQTNACPNCGPQVTFQHQQTGSATTAWQAVVDAARVIRSGGLLALKGVGGFQLVCDATSSSAVERLRHLKQRARKPLAVMVTTVDLAEQIAVVSTAARAVLTSPANPIVLLDARAKASSCEDAVRISPHVHPGLNQLGLLLPGTPLHFLLSRECARPCVVTSGNLSGDPLVFHDDALSERLRAGIDAVLSHDRPILRPVDDSVVRMHADRPVTIRCARGLAPQPLSMETSTPMLAVGAQQKVALALSNGVQAILGPHLGDMGSLEMRQRFIEQVDQLCALYRTRPEVVVHDLHPDLFTTRWAADQGCRTVAVQHHHAHVVSGMLEHGWLDREVLGVAFDGTGFGTDGSIWGGEVLRCTSSQFERVARLRPFSLPGGDRAVREPWRVALALLLDATGPQEGMTVFRRQVAMAQDTDVEAPDQLMRLMLREAGLPTNRRRLFPQTSSAGRLFDGMASLLLGICHASYEGEPAMLLESACDVHVAGEYHAEIADGEVLEIDWRPLLRQALEDMEHGAAVGAVAMKISRGLAAAVADVCQRVARMPVMLTGGCFQNAVLTEQTQMRLETQRRPVGVHQRIPPGDGGLSAGQLAVAAARLQEESETVSGGGLH